MTGPVLSVRSLAARAGDAELVAGVDLDLHTGGVLAVVGPSGSGKSTLGLALLGEAAPGVALTGSVRVGGTELVGTAGRGRVGHLPQHPGAVLDPLRRVGAVLDEMAAVVHGADRAARSEAVGAALRAAQLPTGELSRRFPHQLSGGQQQRMALALALVTGPDVVVLDEPTTGLDADTTRALVESLAGLAESGVALVLLTHDHDVARALAHEALAVRGGQVDAQGPAAEVLDALAAPTVAEPGPETDHPRLRAQGLTVVTADGRAILDGVDLDAAAGAAVAVVGPSGAGKTTLARALAGLAVPRSGTVEVDGTVLRPDALDRTHDGRRAVQYVHQDPRATFAPRRAVLEQVARPAVRLRGLGSEAARAEAVAVLGTLGVDETTARRRPRALSGGQLQRTAVARALLARPDVIVADEATSALDADHQAGLVEVFDQVRRAHGTALVLVSHDLELVGQVAGTTVVLAAGRVVDRGPTGEVLERTAPRVAPR
ncbi:ATP-binding cassette domain-containing protein [Actinomycetospora endophytica]|uniref:ATP-binding cassette domain-containing protein n=1 Tax=Actinomycetospora endophytica TaxID=2291215 RepID=A0ABS8PIQ3_9PSEU|nr:ATP-binding cassette domain-containing protein [Actinomycetospora endophytica]MCD2197375.1 ATP-binding cassette domain-containing protein [Actinomycetospora endophytica]